jgi:hypothetical protein
MTKRRSSGGNDRDAESQIITLTAVGGGTYVKQAPCAVCANMSKNQAGIWRYDVPIGFGS